ncbi:hypothetical protein V1511DRAFT_497189 [Dipodascopsis uninucleata]
MTKRGTKRKLESGSGEKDESLTKLTSSSSKRKTKSSTESIQNQQINKLRNGETRHTLSSKPEHKQQHKINRITLKQLGWSYFQIEALLVLSPRVPNNGYSQLDDLSWYSLINAALRQYLGNVCAGIQFDILRRDMSKISKNPIIDIRTASTRSTEFSAAISGFYLDSESNASTIQKLFDGNYIRVGLKIIKSGSFATSIAAPKRKWEPPAVKTSDSYVP